VDKTAIRNFAVKARRKLIEDISHKAYEIGITKDKILDIETFDGGFRVKGRENGKTFKKYELKQRDKLVQNIKYKGFEQVIEEVAYTWFNRFIALRFMEVNNYLPTGVRVLSSTEEGKTEPDIIQEALNIDLDLDPEIVYRLQDSNDTEDLYRYLLVKQCNQLGKIMPNVFEKIADYTELLLPDKLLAEGSVIRDLVEEIEEEDFKQEEIIGWFYQFYNQEKRDIIFDSNLSDRKKILKNDIPAATQIFTPKWIVQYIVENSLGKLWLESHPNEELKAKWQFYIDESEQEVQKQLSQSRISELNPEKIKVFDPAMGSGHILVYAFDVLYEIYLSAGYSEREIPTLILEKNLYGIEIDDRAAQLATFALLMKARSKNRRIFRNKPKMNLCSIQESNDIPKEAIEYLVSPKETELEKQLNREDVEYLIEVFHDAKEYGSILELREIDFDTLEKRIEEIRNNVPEDLFELQYREIILEKISPLVLQAKIMIQKYDVVCTNPPYMGSRRMNNKIKAYVSKHYGDVKSDLFAVFIKKSTLWTSNHGFIGLVTPYVWWFISSYEKLREYILQNTTISTLIQLEYNAFEGAAMPIGTFVLRNYSVDVNGIYIKLSDFKGIKNQPIKVLEAIQNANVYYRYVGNQKKFLNIPGYTFAYWISNRFYEIFSEAKLLREVAEPKQGLATTDNNRFLRLWFEVDILKIKFNCQSKIEAKESGFKWFPYNKGGEFRKWYGNNEFTVNYQFDGKEIKANVLRKYKYLKTPDFVVKNSDYYFKEGITYTFISNASFGVRYTDYGFIFDVAGSSIFTDDKKIYYLLGFLSTNIAMMLLHVISPTMNSQVGDVGKLPVIFCYEKEKNVNLLVKNNITLSRMDWDSFEISWDFKKHPLLAHKKEADTIEGAFYNWSAFANQQFNQLKANEEELNRIFIDIYGLQDELTPAVDDKDVTITRIYDSKEDIPESMKGNNYVLTREDVIKSFISYAVGCMFGRYSLDEEGLIYAGGDFDDKFRLRDGQWEIKTKEGWKKSTVNIVEHNVIPIADGDYFEDGILERFVEFVKVSFGEDTLEENLDYIAETLGKRANETSRQAIRRYFLKDFYKDHVRTFKKRPIYWLFDSGRQDGFKALIYMHRYDPSTVARVRTDYLHSLQKKYEAEVSHLDILIDSDISQREKAAARKKKETILKQIEECRLYDEAIAHMANQRIEIDLDDGVKVNYAKFQGVEIPQGKGRKPLIANLLAKI
jgi:type II restriction/modification system DNA methylase subunit YeeA